MYIRFDNEDKVHYEMEQFLANIGRGGRDGHNYSLIILFLIVQLLGLTTFIKFK